MLIKCISDVHMGSGDDADDFLIADEAFAKYLDSASDAQPIFILGDLFDIWESVPWQDRVSRAASIAKAHPLSFSAIAVGIREHKIFYILGNHDRDVVYGILNKVSYFGSSIEYIPTSVVVGDKDGTSALLTHGHQWDDANYKFWWFGRAITFCVGLLQRCGWRDADVWLSKNIESKIPGTVAGNNHYIDLAITSAKRQGAAAVVMGHTHDAEVLARNGVTYINTGCVAKRKNGLTETLIELGPDFITVETKEISL